MDPYARRQLFLDDDAVERMAGLRRVIHPPEKRGAVLRPDRSRGQIALQSRSVPQWNPEKRRWDWWYWASYRTPPYGPYRSTSVSLTLYAVSADGVHWQAPDLGLYEWRGTRDNNIAVEPGDPPRPETAHRTVYHVLRDEHDPDPARRYKALFGYRDRRAAVSADGFAWRFLEARPPASQDESHFFYDETTGRYVSLHKQGTEWGRTVFVSWSEDFEHWTKPVLALHADETDQQNRLRRIRAVCEDPDYLSPPIVDDGDHMAQTYQMAAMPYEGLYVGFPVLFNPAGAIPPPQRNYTGINQVELAVSRDLLHWARVGDRSPFLPISPWDGAAYDTSQTLCAGRPVVRGDEIWVYYNACRFRGHQALYPPEYHGFFDDASALCLAVLPRDRFVSLEARDEPAEIVTRTFESRGGALHVNADASGGEIRAEVLEAAAGRPMPGFTAGECVPFSGDDLAGRLAWRGGASLPAGHVRLRFAIRAAHFYAFWIET